MEKLSALFQMNEKRLNVLQFLWCPFLPILTNLILKFLLMTKENQESAILPAHHGLSETDSQPSPMPGTLE